MSGRKRDIGRKHESNASKRRKRAKRDAEAKKTAPITKFFPSDKEHSSTAAASNIHSSDSVKKIESFANSTTKNKKIYQKISYFYFKNIQVKINRSTSPVSAFVCKGQKIFRLAPSALAMRRVGGRLRRPHTSGARLRLAPSPFLPSAKKGRPLRGRASAARSHWSQTNCQKNA
jgi:hypothetical protein